jgi:glycosyltransferase involved in cell wall biosynthesis
MRDMHLPTVSVIIPTHDRNDFLERALRSVSEQVRQPVEVNVVDDLANTDTRDLTTRLYDELEMNIQYFENTGENAGAPGSRNVGSDRAIGEYLAFLDDDDTWDPTYLSHVLDPSVLGDSKIVVTGLMSVDGDGISKPYKFTPQVYDKNDYFLVNPGVLCSNVIVETEAFKTIGGYDASVKGSCDKDLFMRMVKAGFSYNVVSKRLVNWYLHPGQWSVDYSRILPSVIAFYGRYWSEMSILINIRMIAKIGRLSLGSVGSKFSKR